VWFWKRSFGEHGSLPGVLAAAMLFLGSYPVVQALRLEQPALLVAGFIAAAFAAINFGALWVAGIMVGLAMIKPQSAAPIAAWLMLWAVFAWRERKSLLISYVATMTILCAGAELLLPGWLWKWRDAAASYMTYTAGVPTHVQVLFGKHLGGVIAIVLWLSVAALCWKARLDTPSSDRFKLAPALILAVSMAAGPVWHEYDHMFLLPAVLLAFHWKTEFHLMTPGARTIVVFSGLIIAGQWIAALVLTMLAVRWTALARSLQIIPWLPMFFSPTLVLLSLSLIARKRMDIANSSVP
jgi:hypothetical protein